jgi:secreted trypsin-like serine protease
MVALSRGCGATLIAPDRVLTAAHCVEDLRTTDLRVYVGARRRIKGTLQYDGRPVVVAEIASHPRYSGLAGGGPSNDAAVIKLAAAVTDVPLATLAGPGDAPLDDGGRLASVIGWGATRANLRSAPLALGLRKGEMRILSDRACERIYGRGDGYRRDVMLCARSRQRSRRPNTSPCVGDSGGPLVSRGGIQVGIVSFGISCGALHEPTVFSRVAALRSFIDTPNPIWSPQPLDRPTVQGTVAPGQTVTCVPPPWRNAIDATRIRWGLDGLLVGTGPQFLIPADAVGRRLQCRAIASNAGGETPSLPSLPIDVPAA